MMWGEDEEFFERVFLKDQKRTENFQKSICEVYSILSNPAPCLIN